MEPIKALFRSRKFLLLLLDGVIASILFFVGKYTGANVAEDVKFLIGWMQPVFIALITAIAVEDAAQKRANVGRF